MVPLLLPWSPNSCPDGLPVCRSRLYVITGEGGEVAYTESPGGGRLISSPSEVWDYKIRYNRIGQAALPEAHSREMITKTMEGL